MFAVALSLLGLSIAFFIVTIAHLAYQKKTLQKIQKETVQLIEEPKTFVEQYLTKAPELCGWISHELENGEVQFSLHSYSLSEGNGIFGSFIINKNDPIEKLRRDLKYGSQCIVDAYNKHLVVMNTDWNGPQGR